MKEPLDQESILLTVDDVARLLRISRAGAYKMAASGELPTVRFGKSIRIRRETLDAWLGGLESPRVPK